MNNSLLLGQTYEKNSLIFIYILYSALIVYMIYKIVASKGAKKKIQGQAFVYKRFVSKWLYILCTMILVFGIVNIFTADKISGVLMIGLMAVLFISFQDNTVICESGIYGQGVFIEWHELKKWGFDTKRSELICQYKRNMTEKQAYLKIDVSYMEDANAKIKEFKQNKKNE